LKKKFLEYSCTGDIETILNEEFMELILFFIHGNIQDGIFEVFTMIYRLLINKNYENAMTLTAYMTLKKWTLA
jgi:hypothetical protein